MGSTYKTPEEIIRESQKNAVKGGLKISRDATRGLIKKSLVAQKEAIKSSIKLTRFTAGALFGIFTKDLLLNIICSPTSFPFGMIHKIFPLNFCFPSVKEYKDSSSSSEESSGNLYSVFEDYDKTNKELGDNVDVNRIRDTTIETIKDIIQKNVVETTIKVSTNQNVNITCPSGLLDNNPIMRRMAAIKDSNGNWKTGKVDLTTCSNGEKLKYKDDNGDYQYDSCDPIDSSQLLFINKEDEKDIPDKGGWIVEYDDGTVEKNVPEYDEYGERNIRWIYGCCPVANQKARIKVTQIKGDIQKMTNNIKNQVDKMTEDTAVIRGCPVSEVNATINANQEADIKVRMNIQQLIKQKNETAIVAAQNINYTDYYQACHEGGPRVLKQEIDIDVVSSNIVDSSIETIVDNKISLKAASDTSIDFFYESFTPRILIFSFISNMIVLYISALILIKLFKK